MKIGFKLLLLIACGLLVVSCRGKQQTVTQLTEPVVIHSTDTVWERIVESVRVDTVTVTVEIPAQSAMETVRDSVSRLETDFAESTAWINPDGSLGHSLRNKEGSIEADVLVPVKESTTDRGEKSTEQVPVYITQKVPVEVERELSLWQRFRLGAFWWLASIAAGALVWIFRKPLAGLIKRMIK